MGIVLKPDGASPQVLPPLLAELRNEATQALVLPLVLAIIPAQDTPDFLDWTLPSLLPIATSAKVRALAAQSPLSCTPCCTAAPPPLHRLSPLRRRCGKHASSHAHVVFHVVFHCCFTSVHHSGVRLRPCRLCHRRR